MVKKLINYLTYINELVLFKHTVFALPFILVAMIVVSDGWFGTLILVYCCLAAFFARNFAMSFNRLIDIKFDRENIRTAKRPSVDGRLSKSSILFFIVSNALLFILVSYLINSLALKLSIPFLVVLGGYSYMKRVTSLVHLFLGFSLALAPIAGSIAVTGYVPLYIYYLSAGVMFWVTGFDLLFSLQDIKHDKLSDLYSIPSRYGVEFTLKLSLISHILTVMFWFMFIYSARLHFPSYIALFISLAILMGEQWMVRKNLSNISKAFFTLNGYLSIMFLAFIIIDKVLF